MSRRSNDAIVNSTRAAIARAKRRGSSEVSVDDLLVGLLQGMARFGMAIVGEWAIDLEELGENSLDAPPSGTGRGPSFSPEAAAIFDRAAAISRREGALKVGVVHLLAAFAPEEEGLMGRMKDAYGITEGGWREALARTYSSEQNGFPAGDGGEVGHAPGRKDLLSPDEAAAFLGVHTQTVRGYIRAGKLPAYRIGGERFIRILREDLLDLLEPLSPEDAGLPGGGAAA